MDAGPVAILVVVLMVIFTSLQNAHLPPQVPVESLGRPYRLTLPQDRQKMTQVIHDYIFKHIKTKLDDGSLDLMADCIVKYSCDIGVDPVLVTALVERESGFIPDKVSSSGAVGLGQVKPSTGRGLGIDNLFDIEQNIKATSVYIKKMLDLWPGRDNQVSLALASYKEGYGTVSRAGGRYSAHTAQYINDILNNCLEINPSVN